MQSIPVYSFKQQIQSKFNIVLLENSQLALKMALFT